MVKRIIALFLLICCGVYGQQLIVETYESPVDYQKPDATQSKSLFKIIKRKRNKQSAEINFYDDDGKIIKSIPVLQYPSRERVLLSPDHQFVIVSGPGVSGLNLNKAYYPRQYESKVYNSSGEKLFTYRNELQSLKFWGDQTYLTVDHKFTESSKNNFVLNSSGQILIEITGEEISGIIARKNDILVAETRKGIVALDLEGNVFWRRNWGDTPTDVVVSNNKLFCVSLRNQILVLDIDGQEQLAYTVSGDQGRVRATISPDGKSLFWVFTKAIRVPGQRLREGKIGLYCLSEQREVWSRELSVESFEDIGWNALSINFLYDKKYGVVRFSHRGIYVYDMEKGVYLGHDPIGGDYWKHTVLFPDEENSIVVINNFSSVLSILRMRNKGGE